MVNIKQINIKNRRHYFFEDMINSNLLKVNKKSHKNIDIYYIGCITMESINSVNPLYFIVGEVDGYIEEKNGNKYLIFASTDKNKEILEKYTEL